MPRNPSRDLQGYAGVIPPKSLRRHATTIVLCSSVVLAALGLLSTTGASAVGRTVSGRPTASTRVHGTSTYTLGWLGGPGPTTHIFNWTPTRVRGIEGTVVQIATTNSDSYALTSTGSVWAWGTGRHGQLGDGGTVAVARSAVQVHFPPGVKIAFLPNPMPYDAALAVDSRGGVWGWGENNARQLCFRHKGPYLVPRRLPLTGVTLATGAGGHSLFDADGKVVACGLNAAGELGNGTMVRHARLSAVVGLPGGRVKALVSSWQGSGALMSDGEYYDWGYNASGQLGNGRTANSAVPVPVPLPGPVAQVFQGGSLGDNGQTVVVLADHSVWAWGSNAWGQLGTGDKVDHSAPVPVHVPKGVTFAQVATGGYSSYAIDTHGQAWAWGSNRSGQLGLGPAVSAESIPTAIGRTFTQMSATADNVAGLSRT